MKPVRSSSITTSGTNLLIEMEVKNMKNRFYMKEFQYHDGECYVTFNIVDLNELKNEISVAITREGKISVVMYPLLSDENGYYFEYGCEYTKLAVDDFKEVSE